MENSDSIEYGNYVNYFINNEICKVEISSKNFLYPNIRVRTAPPVSVRVRAVVSVSLKPGFHSNATACVA